MQTLPSLLLVPLNDCSVETQMPVNFALLGLQLAAVAAWNSSLLTALLHALVTLSTKFGDEPTVLWQTVA
jgi:hypothetical protein